MFINRFVLKVIKVVPISNAGISPGWPCIVEDSINRVTLNSAKISAVNFSAFKFLIENQRSASLSVSSAMSSLTFAL